LPITPIKQDTVFKLALPKLHDGQKYVMANRKQYNFLAAGRGWRKTTMLIHLMREFALYKQKSVLYTAHTLAPITMVQKEQLRFMFGDSWENVYDTTNKILQPPGWRPIYFASLEEPENVRGKTPGLIINDEGGEMDDGVFASFLAPMAFKLNAEYWQVGTPNPYNPFNDFWRYCMNTRNNPDISGNVIPVVGAKVLGDQLIRVPHPYENPAKTFDELVRSWNINETAMQKIRWRIEMLCEFLMEAGSQVEDPEKVCTVPYVEGTLPNEWFGQDYRFNPMTTYQKGADLAVSGDRLAIGVMDCDTHTQVYMRHFTPDAHTDLGRWNQVYQALKRCDELFPGRFIADITGMGLSVPSTMSRDYGVDIEGINFGGGSAKKVELYDNMSSLIEGRKVALFAHPEVIKELRSLKRRKLANSTEIKGDKGSYDDLAAMVAIMLKDLDGGVRTIEEVVEEYHENASYVPQMNEFASLGRDW
jgi:hypothetical protein